MNQDRERLHTAVLVAPSKERRKLRKKESPLSRAFLLLFVQCFLC